MGYIKFKLPFKSLAFWKSSFLRKTDDWPRFPLLARFLPKSLATRFFLEREPFWDLSLWAEKRFSAQLLLRRIFQRKLPRKRLPRRNAKNLRGIRLANKFLKRQTSGWYVRFAYSLNTRASITSRLFSDLGGQLRLFAYPSVKLGLDHYDVVSSELDPEQIWHSRVSSSLLDPVYSTPRFPGLSKSPSCSIFLRSPFYYRCPNLYRNIFSPQSSFHLPDDFVLDQLCVSKHLRNLSTQRSLYFSLSVQKPFFLLPISMSQFFRNRQTSLPAFQSVYSALYSFLSSSFGFALNCLARSPLNITRYSAFCVAPFAHVDILFNNLHGLLRRQPPSQFLKLLPSQPVAEIFFNYFERIGFFLSTVFISSSLFASPSRNLLTSNFMSTSATFSKYYSSEPLDAVSRKYLPSDFFNKAFAFLHLRNYFSLLNNSFSNLTSSGNILIKTLFINRYIFLNLRTYYYHVKDNTIAQTTNLAPVLLRSNTCKSLEKYSKLQEDLALPTSTLALLTSSSLDKKFVPSSLNQTSLHNFSLISWDSILLRLLSGDQREFFTFLSGADTFFAFEKSRALLPTLNAVSQPHVDQMLDYFEDSLFDKLSADVLRRPTTLSEFGLDTPNSNLFSITEFLLTPLVPVNIHLSALSDAAFNVFITDPLSTHFEIGEISALSAFYELNYFPTFNSSSHSLLFPAYSRWDLKLKASIRSYLLTCNL